MIGSHNVYVALRGVPCVASEEHREVVRATPSADLFPVDHRHVQTSLGFFEEEVLQLEVAMDQRNRRTGKSLVDEDDLVGQSNCQVVDVARELVPELVDEPFRSLTIEASRPNADVGETVWPSRALKRRIAPVLGVAPREAHHGELLFLIGATHDRIAGPRGRKVFQ